MSHGPVGRRSRGSSRSSRGKRRKPSAALNIPAIAVLGVALPFSAGGGSASARAPSTVLCMGWKACATRGFASYDYAGKGYQSYWQMSSGDECTNYVAYVESRIFGAPAPRYSLGNGGQWAADSAAHGVVVNNVPSVGAVAEWNGGAFGMGPLGHVAVVEKVGPRGKYIVISQQHIYTDVNGFDWSRINAGFSSTSWQEWPDSFIHFPVKGHASVGYFNARRGFVDLRVALAGGPPDAAFRLARPGMVALAGNWTGRSPGIGYYNPKTGWFHLRNGLQPSGSQFSFRFGPAGMIPLAGRWTGQAADRIGYYDPRTGTFYLRDSLTAGPASHVVAFEPPGMIPLTGNWDGKGGDGIGYYNPRTGRFYLRNALSAGRPDYAFAFGRPGMIPVAGNWDGGAAARRPGSASMTRAAAGSACGTGSAAGLPDTPSDSARAA